MKKLILLLIILLPLPLLAQDSSQFVLSVVAGEDTTPPTAPNIISAMPTASTQIDVTWLASVDDVVVYGYVVLRDGVPVATTTLTSYTDTGLTPSTLYAYEAYAFDGFYNISSTSNQLSTTTLAIPVTPIATSSPSSATLVFMLLDFDISLGTNEAKLSWRTSKPARYELRWGRGDSYDTGYVVNDTYRNEHSTSITQLEPGTTYQYELIGYSASGEVITLKKGEFKTKSIESTVPLNVLGFFGRAAKADVLLSWIMPENSEGKVRVVRSHLGYPNSPYDGAIVFDGIGTKATDLGILSRYDEVFYTAFVIMPDGSVSSGAVSKVQAESIGIEEVPLEIEDIEVTIPDILVPEIWEFDRNSISLIQGSQIFSFATNTKPSLNAEESFLIRIPLPSVPDNLKSIIVTVTDPGNHALTHSFLLRINKEGTSYEAVVPPLSFAGDSRVMIQIYDFERMMVGRYTQVVSFELGNHQIKEVIFPDKIVGSLKSYLPYAGVTILLLSIFLVMWRLRDEDKE